MTRKTAFLEGWYWFKFNNLGLALGKNLKLYTSVAKELKLKVRNFLEATSYVYAVQHGKGNLNILEDEISASIAVLLLPEYCKVPYRDLYWADAPDAHNEAVSCAMSRNRFRAILSNLHLADNTQITEDRYNKVRVLYLKI